MTAKSTREQNSNTTTIIPNAVVNDNDRGSSSLALKHIELSENFYINNKKKNNVKIQVKLNAEGIYLRRETEQFDQINEQLIRIEDIIGSRCGPRLNRMRGSLSSCKRITEDEQTVTQTGAEPKDISAFLYVYAYVRKDKPLQRCRTLRILRFRSYGSYEENFKSAERWHHAIKVNKAVNNNRSMECDKQVLILLNPKAGSGKAREIFQKLVAPMLKEAELQYDLHVTTHANYAREFVYKRADLLNRYSGIIVAAGDGLFYEVLNGIMKRPDWSVVARHMPIGVIPCGSGNGLARSIAHLYNEPYQPEPILNATLTCLSGHTAPLDVVRVELARGNRHTELYSFLSIGWGLIADVDIESERLRSIGSSRFTLWSIHRLIRLRTYRGKLSYIPWRKGAEQPQSSHNRHETVTDGVPDDDTSTQQDFYDAEDSNDQDVFSDAMSIDQSGYTSNANSWHSATSRRTAYYSIGGQSMRSQSSNKGTILGKIEAANVKFQTKMLSSTIPPLNMPVPTDTWHCEEGDYIMVHAAYTTHLGSDCYFLPDSRLNDGIIYLVIIRKGASRPQVLQFMLNMSSGTHLPEQPNEYIQLVPVRAFRIEPNADDGILAVDGERVDYGAIQAEIFPGLVRVMVPNAK